jgi:hypothetical protein
MRAAQVAAVGAADDPQTSPIDPDLMAVVAALQALPETAQVKIAALVRQALPETLATTSKPR